MLMPENVFLAVKPVDMRRGIDTLTQYVQDMDHFRGSSATWVEPFRPEDSSPVASVTRTQHARTSAASAFSGDLHALRLHRYSIGW